MRRQIELNGSRHCCSDGLKVRRIPNSSRLLQSGRRKLSEQMPVKTPRAATSFALAPGSCSFPGGFHMISPYEPALVAKLFYVCNSAFTGELLLIRPILRFALQSCAVRCLIEPRHTSNNRAQFNTLPKAAMLGHLIACMFCLEPTPTLIILVAGFSSCSLNPSSTDFRLLFRGLVVCTYLDLV